MDKKPASFKTELPRSVLYLDDIISIATLMAEDERSVLLKFTHGGSEYSGDCVEKIKEIPALELSKINEASLECLDGNARDFISTDFKSVVAKEKTAHTIGLANQIESIVKKRRAFSDKAESYIFAAYLLIVASEMIAVVAGWHAGFFVILGISAVAAFFLTALIYKALPHTTIFLAMRKDSPSFWKRNKDTIIVGIIVGVVVAFAAGVVGYFVGLDQPASIQGQ